MEYSSRFGRGLLGEYGLRLARGTKDEAPVLALNGRIHVDGSRSCLRGCCAVLCSAAAPLHIPSWFRLRLVRRSLRFKGPDTDCSLRPSRERLPPQSVLTLGSCGQVQVAHQTGWASRGPLLCNERRADATIRNPWCLSWCCVDSKKGSRESLPPSLSPRPSPRAWGRGDSEGGRDGPLLSSRAEVQEAKVVFRTPFPMLPVRQLHTLVCI